MGVVTMKGNKVLLFSLLLALLGLLLVYGYINKKEQSLLESATPIKVVVAVKDLPVDTRLDDSVVEVMQVPKKYVQPGAVADVDSIFDRVLSVPVLRGTQILESMFKPATTESLAQKVPSGMRAISIAANQVSAVAGLIKPGDYVDLYLTVETGEYDEEGRMTPEDIMTKRILQNVLVLAHNQTTSKSEYEKSRFEGGQGAPGTVFSQVQLGKSRQHSEIKTLTLALSSEDAQKVTMAQEIGSVTVALRSSWDQKADKEMPSLTSKALLGIESNVISKSTPAWIEIRGAERLNPIPD